MKLSFSSLALSLFFPIKNAIFLISYACPFFDRTLLGKCVSLARRHDGRKIPLKN